MNQSIIHSFIHMIMKIIYVYNRLEARSSWHAKSVSCVHTVVLHDETLREYQSLIALIGSSAATIATA